LRFLFGYLQLIGAPDPGNDGDRILVKDLKAIFFNVLAKTLSHKRRTGTLTAILFKKQTCGQTLNWQKRMKTTCPNSERPNLNTQDI